MLKMVPLFWKWSSVRQIWSQIKKLIFLENCEGWGGASKPGFSSRNIEIELMMEKKHEAFKVKCEKKWQQLKRRHYNRVEYTAIASANAKERKRTRTDRVHAGDVPAEGSYVRRQRAKPQ